MRGHHFTGYLHGHTARALLFQSHYWHAPRWLPRSQCLLEADVDCSEVSVRVSDWLCDKNGIHEFREIEDHGDGVG